MTRLADVSEYESMSDAFTFRTRLTLAPDPVTVSLIAGVFVLASCGPAMVAKLTNDIPASIRYRIHCPAVVLVAL